jgi:hypothetical protein
MPRIRTIKPSFWKDQKVGRLKRDVRLMFIGLWNLADDDGVVCADYLIIKSELFPFDEDLRVKTIQDWIAQLIEALMIIPFTFNGESYYVIRTFKAHQSINRPQESKIPTEIIQKVLAEHSMNTHGTVTAGKERKRMEGKGKEEVSFSFKNPFSDNFSKEWELWKKFKGEQFSFFYKTAISEQAAVNELVNLSKGDETAAVKIIRASIANGWKGFFELKIENNGNSEAQRKSGSQSESVRSAFSKIDSMPD